MKATRLVKKLLLAVTLSYGTVHAQDTTSVSWLPVASKSNARSAASSDPTVDAFLKTISGSLRVIACNYQGPLLKKQVAFYNNTASLAGADFTYTLKTARPAGNSEVLDLNLTVAVRKGNAASAGVAVAFDFANWKSTNYVMVPSAIYNGNRNRIVERAYATGLAESDLYRKSLPLTTTDLPQLSPKPGSVSRFEINTGSASTPAMTFYDKTTKRGFILLIEQKSRLGNFGMIVEENASRSSASFVVSAPGVRSKLPVFVGFENSPDRGVNWAAGEQLNFKFRIISFSAPNIPAFLAKFVAHRKDLTGETQPRDQVPFSTMLNLLTTKIDNTRWYGGAKKYYRNENADWISVGWVAGLMNTYPMLLLGDSLHRQRVVQTFNYAIPATQGKSGYFYTLIDSKGNVRSREGYDKQPELSLVRRNGDVLFWMIKQFMVLKAQGHASQINPTWEKAMQRLADAFVATWTKHKTFGNFVNVSTGDVGVYNSTSGAMAVGGLALAAKYFNKPKYQQVASEAGMKFYNEDILKTGQTTGCCSDILQNADSETAFGLMTSYMALYETTSQAHWLNKAKVASDLANTWVVSYNYIFPKNSRLGQLDAHVAGAIWASTQNKHAAPGICTSSSDPFFKLYRATGNRKYAQILKEIQHAHTEVVEREGRPTNGAGPGSVMERIQLSDSEGAARVGNFAKNSNGWCEANGAMMALEIPGIYVQTDKNVFFVFDHVKAKVVSRDANGVQIQITNRTAYPASVAVFAETAAKAKTAQGYTANLTWPHVQVAAGKTVTFALSKDGKIRK